MCMSSSSNMKDALSGDLIVRVAHFAQEWEGWGRGYVIQPASPTTCKYWGPCCHNQCIMGYSSRLKIEHCDLESIKRLLFCRNQTYDNWFSSGCNILCIYTPPFLHAVDCIIPDIWMGACMRWACSGVCVCVSCIIIICLWRTCY